MNTCAKPCSQNSDCHNNCCSLGYCSSSTMCAGHKEAQDNCNTDSECISGSCSLTEPGFKHGSARVLGSDGQHDYVNTTNSFGQCLESENASIDSSLIADALIVVAAIIICVGGTVLLFCKRRQDRNHRANPQRGQSFGGGGNQLLINESVNQSRESRRRHGSRSGSGHNQSSDRRSRTRERRGSQG